MLRGQYNIRSQLGWSCRLLPSKASWVLLIRSMILGMVTLEVVGVGAAEEYLSSNLIIKVGVRAHTMVVAACNGIPSNLVNTLLLSPCLIKVTVSCSSQCNSNKTWRVSKELVNMLTSRLWSASSLIRVSLSNTTNCKNFAYLFYKNILELNITYSLGKNCPYKDRCSFAHGEHELRLISGPGGMGSGGSPPMMPPPPQQQQ